MISDKKAAELLKGIQSAVDQLRGELEIFAAITLQQETLTELKAWRDRYTRLYEITRDLCKLPIEVLK